MVGISVGMGLVYAPRSLGGGLEEHTASHVVRCERAHGGAEPADASRGFTSLVARMLTGDAEAFRLVYRAVQPGLIRYMTALVGAGEAEDVASETWAQAVRDLHRFRGDGDGFRAWITTIGRHRALDHLRAKDRRPIVDTPVDELADRAGGDDTEQGALESMSTAEVLVVIRSLPPDQAEAVLLRAVMGLDARTAGKVLGKRAGAVRTAAYRGLRTLTDRLDQDPKGAPRQRGDAFPGDNAHEME
ncbi:MAG: RNA polymerase sigma factor [Mycobacterium sp.]|nr:RNA polymerase sigma factor [Mycobacterium sp.]